MYGQKPLEIVQGPGEVLFLPQGLTHSILNLHDNVAYTENYLYIGALPGMLLKTSLRINLQFIKFSLIT